MGHADSLRFRSIPTWLLRSELKKVEMNRKDERARIRDIILIREMAEGRALRANTGSHYIIHPCINT